MSDASLSRLKEKNIIHARVLAMQSPESWNPPTMLLRLILVHGEEIFIHATGDARTSLSRMDPEKVYQIHIPGVSVRVNSNMKKNGVMSKFEVRLSKSITVEESPQVWPLKVQYEFKELNEMERLQVGDFIDVKGFVLHDPSDNSEEGSLKKKTFLLALGEYAVHVELLGVHAALTVTTGDFFVFRGIKVTSWQAERKLSTGFLTFVVRNPPDLRKRHAAEQPDASSPTKKAMKMEVKNVIEFQEVYLEITRLKNAATALLETALEVPVQRKQVQFKGQYMQFTDDIFLKETPFYEKSRLMLPRLAGVLTDGTNQLPVTLWSTATEVLFKCDAKSLWEKWSQCESEEGKEEFLTILNSNAGTSFRFACTLQTWGRGRPIQIEVNCNVDAVELL